MAFKIWCLAWRKEHRLRGFKKMMMLWKIFGPNIEEVTRGWKKLHNVEHRDICCLLRIVQIKRSTKVSWMGCGRA